MAGTVSEADTAGLEGLCGPNPGGARIRLGSGARGIERLEAQFSGRGFAPHRHDTYAIGVTLSGVQSFRYRGAVRHCLLGQCHILHPDEPHDGVAGTAAGFAYRIVHVDPALLQQAIGGCRLPFVADPVLELPPSAWVRLAPAWDLGSPLDEIGHADLVAAIGEVLSFVSDGMTPSSRLDIPALWRVRDLIAGSPARGISARDLERLSGLDRWSLARQFRAAFGTSPSRYRIMRQLDVARQQIVHGASLADAALAAGFSDQSHLSRQFKRAYGLTPGRWASAVRRGQAAHRA